MIYVPLHGSRPSEKLYRDALEIPDKDLITITIVVSCTGKVLEVFHEKYHD
jgi:hypothetical protein